MYKLSASTGKFVMAPSRFLWALSQVQAHYQKDEKFFRIVFLQADLVRYSFSLTAEFEAPTLTLARLLLGPEEIATITKPFLCSMPLEIFQRQIELVKHASFEALQHVFKKPTVTFMKTKYTPAVAFEDATPIEAIKASLELTTVQSVVMDAQPGRPVMAFYRLAPKKTFEEFQKELKEVVERW